MSKYMENKLAELVDRQDTLITLQIDIRDKVTELVELKKIEMEILLITSRNDLTVSRRLMLKDKLKG